jgi:hypothetical protein
MKKIVFILALLLLTFTLCMISSAAQITNGQEFKAALTSGADGEYTISGDLSDTSEAIHITNTVNLVFNLAGDTVLDDNITLSADASITFNLNGYNLKCTRSGGDYDQGFLRINSQNCCITLNGQKNEDGSIVNSIQTSDLLVYCHGGKIVCNNVNITSAEAMFYSRNVNLPTIIQVDGGNYRVTGADPFMSNPNTCNNSYFKNCTLSTEKNKTITLDDNCSDAFRNTVYGGKGYDLVFENVLMDNFTFVSKTSLINFVFIDLVNNLDDNPDNNITMSNITLGSDRHKAVTTAEATIINSSTCIKQGTSQHKTYKEPNVVTTSLPLMDHVKSNVVLGIEYESYLENGHYQYACANEGCDAKIVGESVEALFDFIGFSTPEDGSYGIVASYIVNVKAIAQYEEKTGKTLSYGIVAGAKTLLGENNPLDKDGNTLTLEKGSVVKAEITREYASYDFILKGMNENQLDIELVIATYVEITENGETSVVYLQETQKTEI